MNTEQVHHISKQQFMQIRVDFVRHVDDIESFLDEALSNGLLIEGHRNEIMSQRNPDDQIRKLHDYIFKKLPYDSDKLMSALKKSKHIKIFDLLDEQTAYPMKFKPHGRVILINNVKFDDEETYKERHGSEKDVEGITKLFTDFNFDVHPHPNKTAKEMKIIIEEATSKSTSGEDCFVMFLMSHGIIGNIVGTDGKELSYSTINTILKESSQLKDKPKLIYINACQAKSEKEDVKQYFDVADLHVTFATVPESLAYRSSKRGSLFIESLLTVYKNNKEKCGISSLSFEINAQVAEKNDKISKDQVSSNYSTLKREVILQATD